MQIPELSRSVDIKNFMKELLLLYISEYQAKHINRFFLNYEITEHC